MSAFRRFAAVGLVAALALTACDSGSTGQSPSAAKTGVVTPSAVAPSDPQSAKAVQDGVDAYRKLLDAFVAASNNGSADTTEMARYGSGRALSLLRNILAGYKSSRLHSQGAPRIDQPTVTGFTPAANPTSVRMTGCVDRSRWQFYQADGKPAETNGPAGAQGPDAINASVEKGDAGWKVTDMVITGICPS